MTVEKSFATRQTSVAVSVEDQTGNIDHPMSGFCDTLMLVALASDLSESGQRFGTKRDSPPRSS